MSVDAEFSFHLFDEREFRERFLPAVQGDEAIVRELLDAADAAGPSWTALHKMFDETRESWLRAVETEDGGALQRTLFASFCRLLAHFRPAFCVRGFGLSSIDRREFPDLAARIRSGGALLVDSEDALLPNVPALVPARVPVQCASGHGGGGVVLKADVRPLLEAYRRELPRLIAWASERGLPAEPGVTMLLAALVEAKLKGSALVEGRDVLVDDTHLSKRNRLSFEQPAKLAPAVLREAGKLFGRSILPPPAPKPVPVPGPIDIHDYSPQGSYQVGQQLQHKAFGRGEVMKILDSRRLRVQFDAEEKTLIQGLPPRPGQTPPSPAPAD